MATTHNVIYFLTARPHSGEQWRSAIARYEQYDPATLNGGKKPDNFLFVSAEGHFRKWEGFAWEDTLPPGHKIQFIMDEQAHDDKLFPFGKCVGYAASLYNKVAVPIYKADNGANGNILHKQDGFDFLRLYYATLGKPCLTPLPVPPKTGHVEDKPRTGNGLPGTLRRSVAGLKVHSLKRDVGNGNGAHEGPEETSHIDAVDGDVDAQVPDDTSGDAPGDPAEDAVSDPANTANTEPPLKGSEEEDEPKDLGTGQTDGEDLH